MKKIEVTRKLIGILKAYTKLYDRIEGKYHKEICRLEKMMEKETGVKGIKFIRYDGEMVGIDITGDSDNLELIHRSRLEE